MARPAAAQAQGGERRYVDPVFGFELVRPVGNWRMEINDERSPEGVAVPVVLHDADSGAQVVLQVAPAVATPSEFAFRLAAGLRRHPGFIAADPEPLPLSENAVGFGFTLGDAVRGRVAVIEGGPGHIFMLMATWPTAAPSAISAVDEIFRSVRPVPRT
ncbi:MAG: hypothetical protein ACYC8T_15315 [Myxococcaceae bacterium]